MRNSKIETDRFRLWAGLALLIVAIAGCEGGGDGIARRPDVYLGANIVDGYIDEL
ncbi:MAG: hypothetical protein OEV32_07085 [Gammaproteobacteria bacterium]|nr:hypothetical protein [Gammaproteobacteria bacterium]